VLSAWFLFGFPGPGRSCVEVGIETKLDQKGLRKQLDALGFNKVQGLLKLAVTSGVLDDLTFYMADEIRRTANKAVHGSFQIENAARTQACTRFQSWSLR
jgi:hypothetical protein